MFGPNISRLLAKRQLAKERIGRHLLPDWDAAHEYEYKRAIALDLNDEEALRQLEFEAKREAVRQSLSSNFGVRVKKGGALVDRGKLNITKDKIHGKSMSPEVMNSYLMTFDSMKNGSIVDRPAASNAYDKYIEEAAGEVLSPQAISELAKPGLRDGVASISDKSRLGRAGDRTVEYGNGYDDSTGALLAGMPTEGGHGDDLPHAIFPEYSDARWNMRTELKYPNKSKGKRTGEKALIAIRNGIRNKMKADDSGDVIRSVAKGWQVGGGSGDEPMEVIQPMTMREALQSQANLSRDTINMEERELTSPQLNMRIPVRKAGEHPAMLEIASGSRKESPGDSKERALYIDSGGGDVTIGQDVLRSNGNGKGKHKGNH